MKHIKTPVYFATGFLLFISVAQFFGVPDLVIVLAWTLSPIVVIWMVLRVLKDGEAPDLTFDDQFYEDYPVERTQEKAVEGE